MQSNNQLYTCEGTMSTIIAAVLMWVYVVSGYRYAAVTIYGRCINHIVESSRKKFYFCLVFRVVMCCGYL